MFAFILGFALTGLPPLAPEGPPIAPTDINVGDQQIELRGPLVAKTPGARLVLFVRDGASVAGTTQPSQAAFEAALPAGSVTARLATRDGRELTLEHTDYVYYRGFSGLVLTEREPGTRQTRYDHLAINAATALPEVRFMWLDQLTRTVRDVPGPR